MIGKNINEKRWLVIVSAVIIIFSGVAVGFGLQALASTRSNNLTASVGIGSDIGAAYGFNATGKNPTWEVGTLTTPVKGDSVNVTFTKGSHKFFGSMKKYFVSVDLIFRSGRFLFSCVC